MVGRPFEEALFREITELLEQGKCPAGWLDIELQDIRLTCLIHKSRPFLAGLVEPERFSWVPLCDLVLRARQLEGAICSLYKADLVRVLLMAVHFRNLPVLQATTRFVDLTHVLDVLAKDGHDAGLALERSGVRTLLFLQKGVPTRLFFGNTEKVMADDSVTNRFLLYGFAPNAPEGKVEVFNRLSIEPDPDAGRALSDLADEAKPPPPMNIVVHLHDRVEMSRPFMPPFMIIGRDHTCELNLGSLSISRRHAKLSWKRGRFVVEDLKSANGTTVNGQRIMHAELSPGDRIGAGIYEFVLEAPKDLKDPKATVMLIPDTDDQTLYIAGEDQSVPLNSEIIIGKGPSADIKAAGMSVKANHAIIKIEGSGVFRLVCIGRANVVLNGKKTNDTYVKAGDEIKVGKSRFRFISVPNV